jgi:hypothetical protein
MRQRARAWLDVAIPRLAQLEATLQTHQVARTVAALRSEIARAQAIVGETVGNDHTRNSNTQ